MGGFGCRVWKVGSFGCRVFGPFGVLGFDGAGIALGLVLLVLGFLSIVGVGVGVAALRVCTLAVVSDRDSYLGTESLVLGD